MDEIFTSPNSVFFKSAIPLTVEPGNNTDDQHQYSVQKRERNQIR